METIGQRIKRLREGYEYSQDFVAKKVGVSRVAVTKWESGQTANLKLGNLMNLCKLLNVSVEYLIYGEVPGTEKTKNTEGNSAKLITKKDKKIKTIVDSLPFLDEEELDATKTVTNTFKNKKTSKKANNK